MLSLRYDIINTFMIELLDSACFYLLFFRMEFSQPKIAGNFYQQFPSDSDLTQHDKLVKYWLSIWLLNQYLLVKYEPIRLSIFDTFSGLWSTDPLDVGYSKPSLFLFQCPCISLYPIMHWNMKLRKSPLSKGITVPYSLPTLSPILACSQTGTNPTHYHLTIDYTTYRCTWQVSSSWQSQNISLSS